jgi:hypothetical protein
LCCVLGTALGALAIALGCNGDSTAPPFVAPIELSASNLRTLDRGHYEAWLTYAVPETSDPTDRAFVSIGKFDVGPFGALLDLDGALIREWRTPAGRPLSEAIEAWISIEPEGDDDALPAGLVLGGEFAGTPNRASALLSVAYGPVFETGTQLNDVYWASLDASYTLETPSDTVSDDENRGIYWRDGDSPGLELPRIESASVVYEGWIEDESAGRFYSTGRFRDPDSADFDGSGLGSTAGAPMFPGQEFVANPILDLDSGAFRALVTLEPANDNDPDAPTQLILFDDSIDGGAPTGEPVAMRNRQSALPFAIAVVRS